MKNTTLLVIGLLNTLGAMAGTPPKVAAQSASPGPEFTANRNQWAKPVLFATDIPNGRLYLERGRLVQALYDGKQVHEYHHHSAHATAAQKVRAHAYAVTFVGANPTAPVAGEEQLPGYSNYFLGADPARWASEVPGYAAVRYRGIYPGTDLRFYRKAGTLEYDFELAAGASAKSIAIRYDGQNRLQVVKGALHITTSVGTVVEQQPYAYQRVAGKAVRVPCDYALKDSHTVTFSLPKGYNTALPLVIDPVLIYSSYTGSAASNYGYTATYDSLGNLYAGGVVFDTGYPTTLGAYSASYRGGQDIGIMKFNPSASTPATSRVYATYIGGSDDDHPHSLVVDHAGNLVVMGSSSSANYPTTTSAYDRALGGSTDIILSKLSATGSAMLASTYLGGSGIDGQVAGDLNNNYGDSYRGDVTIDALDNIYVASITQSTNFPTQTSSFQRTSGGGVSDGVIVKLNTGLSALVWSNYLGGSGTDAAYSVQLDSVNNVFVGGGTTSRNFPGTTGGYKSSYSGGTADGFIARIVQAGNDLVQSTYLGTSSYDQAYFIQLNKRGEVYAYGQTDGNYPITAGVYGNVNSRQFIHKLSPRLTSSYYSTVIGNGARGQISPTAFLVDNCGQIMISGWGGDNSGFPVTPDAIRSTGGTGSFGYFYIAQLSGDATRLVYGTFFGSGSSHVDGGTSRFDKKGIIYQSMCTGGGNLPTTPNAWSASNGSSWNNAAFKIDVLQINANFFPAVIPTTYQMLAQRELCAPARFYFNRESQAGTGVIWDFGNGQTSTQSTGASALYMSPGRYTVRLTVYDSTSCLQSVTFTDTVRVSGLPRAAAGPDRAVCPGYGTTLTVADAGAGATYRWSPATGLNTATGRSVIATPSVTTRYIVQVNIPSALNCVGYDTVVVTVRAPLAVSAGPNREVCPGSSTTLTAPSFGPGSTYVWSPALGLSSTSDSTVTASPTATTTYTVVATDANGCTGQASVTLTVPTPPTVVATASAPNIEGKPVAFVNTTVGANSYSWDFGDSTPVSTEVNPTHVYAVGRQQPYQVRLTAFYGNACAETLEIPVLVRQFELPNVITPNGDQLNDTFQPFVTAQPVDIQVFSRWGRKVFEQTNYVDGWDAANVPAGMYYYHMTNAAGESWKGWLEVIK